MIFVLSTLWNISAYVMRSQQLFEVMKTPDTLIGIIFARCCPSLKSSSNARKSIFFIHPKARVMALGKNEENDGVVLLVILFLTGSIFTGHYG